jgi:hypothetical protein
MVRKTLLAACCLLVMGATGFGQVALEHKFIEGSSYTVETTTKTEQTLTIAGMEVATTGDSRTTSKVTIGKREGDGKLRVQEKTEAMIAAIGVNGMTYHFDSANPDNKGDSPLEMLREMHKELMSRTQTVIYDKYDKAVAVESDREIGNSLPDEIKALVKDQLDPQTLKDTANNELEQIKSEPVSKGETWRRTRNANFGGGQNMDFETEFTYVGPVEKDGKTLDKITTKALSVNYSLAKSPLPFTVKNIELKPTESEGVILFDRAKGRAVESTSSTRITGTMTFTVNGNDLPVKLDLKLQSSTLEKP